MEGLLRLILYVIVWFFVPGVLIVVIRYLARSYKKTEIKSRRHSLRAGFWAGFMLFLIMLIYQLTLFLKTGFPHDDIFRGFNVWLSLAVALVVFITTTSGTLTSWMVLILTFISFTSLFHYIFIRTYNDIILSVVTGVAFGFLAHLAASLSSLDEFRDTKEQSTPNEHPVH
jgi:hypothetical protein